MARLANVGAEGTVKLGNMILPKYYFRMEKGTEALANPFRFWLMPRDAAARDLAEAGGPVTSKEIEAALATWQP